MESNSGSIYHQLHGIMAGIFDLSSNNKIDKKLTVISLVGISQVRYSLSYFRQR